MVDGGSAKEYARGMYICMYDILSEYIFIEKCMYKCVILREHERS